MASALDSRFNDPGLNPGWEHCVVFLSNPGVQMDNGTGSYADFTYR